MTQATAYDEHPDAPGVLLVLNDVLEEVEVDFNRWYQQQHVPERLNVPGFLTGRRYRALNGTPAYMAIYECASIAVLSSAPYQERLAHPTDWTKRIMPAFRNMLRSACRQTWSVGDGVGGTAIVVQCRPLPGRESDARRFIAERLAPALMQADGVVRIALWEADSGATGGTSTEMALRNGPDNYAEWVLFIESYDLVRLAAALRVQTAACVGAETGLEIGESTQYQLIFSRHAASACLHSSR